MRTEKLTLAKAQRGKELTTDYTDGDGWREGGRGKRAGARQLGIRNGGEDWEKGGSLPIILILILIEKFHLMNYEWFDHDKPQHLLHLSPLISFHV